MQVFVCVVTDRALTEDATSKRQAETTSRAILPQTLDEPAASHSLDFVNVRKGGLPALKVFGAVHARNDGLNLTCLLFAELHWFWTADCPACRLLSANRTGYVNRGNYGIYHIFWRFLSKEA